MEIVLSLLSIWLLFIDRYRFEGIHLCLHCIIHTYLNDSMPGVNLSRIIRPSHCLNDFIQQSYLWWQINKLFPWCHQAVIIQSNHNLRLIVTRQLLKSNSIIMSSLHRRPYGHCFIQVSSQGPSYIQEQRASSLYALAPIKFILPNDDF